MHVSFRIQFLYGNSELIGVTNNAVLFVAKSQDSINVPLRKDVGFNQKKIDDLPKASSFNDLVASVPISGESVVVEHYLSHRVR